MAYALIYTAKSSGKTSYWANPGFTGNGKRKYTWDSPKDINFKQLNAKYPTLFGNKSNDRFEILNLTNGQKQKITYQVRQVNKVSKEATPPLATHPKMFRKTPYLIVLDRKGQPRKYWSNSQKAFVNTVNDRLSRWKELSAAEESLRWIVNNQQLKAQFSGGTITIWNGQTNQPVLSPSEVARLVAPQPTQVVNQVVKQAQKVSQQSPTYRALDQHFAQLPTQADLKVDTATDDELPGIDLSKYDPALVFGAASYLIDALKEQKNVNQLLKRYDGAVLQDYLHVLEFVGLDDLDVDEFTATFQENRQTRRQIKNLSLLLNALAQSFEPNKFWKALEDDSASNQYHFRSASTAKKLQKLIKSYGETNTNDD